MRGELKTVGRNTDDMPACFSELHDALLYSMLMDSSEIFLVSFCFSFLRVFSPTGSMIHSFHERIFILFANSLFSKPHSVELWLTVCDGLNENMPLE